MRCRTFIGGADHIALIPLILARIPLVITSYVIPITDRNCCDFPRTHARGPSQVWPKTKTPASMVLFQQFGVQVRRPHLGAAARVCLLVCLFVCLCVLCAHGRSHRWGEPSPGADVGKGEPSPGADVGKGEPSPGADVGRVSPVLVQIPSFQWKVVRATTLFPEDNGIIAWYERDPREYPEPSA
jgi:hypothetical protein